MLPDPAAADLEAELDLLGQTLQDTAISPRGGNREPNPPWSVLLAYSLTLSDVMPPQCVSMFSVYSCTVWCSFLQKASGATFQ